MFAYIFQMHFLLKQHFFRQFVGFDGKNRRNYVLETLMFAVRCVKINDSSIGFAVVKENAFVHKEKIKCIC